MKIVGITMIITGVLLIIWSFVAYARHRLTENFGMIWSVAALCLLALGVVLAVAGQNLTAVVAVAILLGLLLMFSLIGLSQAISVLIMKNQELAMQVSLLNQENESILRELTTIKEQANHE